MAPKHALKSSPAKSTDAAGSEQKAPKQTKKAQLIELLSAGKPMPLEKLSSALGWQRHTTSAAMTRLKQEGHTLVSDKPAAGVRVYHIATPKLRLRQEGKGHDESHDKARTVSSEGKAQ